MRTLSTLFLCAISFGVAWAQSQSTSQIQGVVQDASGAAVPGAQVTATQTDTGATRVVTTSADGGYVLANLPPNAPAMRPVVRAIGSFYTPTWARAALFS